MIAVAVAVLVVTYRRLWYGVDLTDESFYVVLPYRLVLGARPFVDETSVTQQTTAILLYPFVRAWYAAAGMTGIVLFVRHLQLVLSLVVAFAVYGSARLLLDARRAAVVALACVAFVPFAIHSVSYDSAGSALFTAGCLLGLRPLIEPRRRWSGIVGGVCLGLAAFAYPPLLIPVAFSVAVQLVLRRGRGIVGAALALGLPLAGMGALVAGAGLSKVVDDYRRSSTFLGQAGGTAKVAEIARHTWTTFPMWWVVLPALALLGLVWRYRRVLALPLLLALPILVLPQTLDSFRASLDYAAHFGLLGLPLFFLVRRRRGALPLLLAVWLPGFVAGLTTAYSSANGGVNFAVGGFATAIATAVFLVLACEDALVSVPRVDARIVALVPAVAVLAVLAIADTWPVYRDSNLSALTARVPSGPYAGLVTTPWKARYVVRMQHDLSRFGERCTILFFDDFPAGYLLSDAKPDTNGAWTATVASNLTAPYERQLLGYYGRRGYPDVVVIVRRIPYAARSSGRSILYRTNEPLVAAVRSRGYQLVRWRRAYAVYERLQGCGRQWTTRTSGGSSTATERGGSVTMSTRS